MKFVEDEHWIQSKAATPPSSFNSFVKKFFGKELEPVLFLHDFLERSSIEGILQVKNDSLQITKAIIGHLKIITHQDQKTFSIAVLKLMSELFEFEHQLNLQRKEDGKDPSLTLYRTFDSLDEIFQINYLLETEDLGTQKERLYNGAGVGVQSSYATTLLALRYLNLPKGARFIDLGSGYGRIGLVIGLLRPDVEFFGYEFVKERVDIANASSKNLEIERHVKFIAQDLSAEDFAIPAADVYYIYDSFTDPTYLHVLGQLEKICQKRKITVISKGNARQWFKLPSWSAPQEFNGGNLCIFRSLGSRRP